MGKSVESEYKLPILLPDTIKEGIDFIVAKAKEDQGVELKRSAASARLNRNYRFNSADPDLVEFLLAKDIQKRVERAKKEAGLKKMLEEHDEVSKHGFVTAEVTAGVTAGVEDAPLSTQKPVNSRLPDPPFIPETDQLEAQAEREARMQHPSQPEIDAYEQYHGKRDF